MHPDADAETYRRSIPPRVLFWAHLLVPDPGVDSSSVQFSCSAVVMILCTASSGGSVVFKQRVMDGGGWFPSSVCGFFGAQGFNAVPGCCVEGVLPELIFLQGFG